MRCLWHAEDMKELGRRAGVEAASILLVDEDAVGRTAIAETLRLWLPRVSVTTAPTLHAARSCLAAQRYDLVVCEYMLSGAEDFALCREIRARWPDLPVAILTGAIDVTPEAARQAGAWTFLTKPVDREALLEAVSGLLQRVHRRSAPASAA